LDYETNLPSLILARRRTWHGGLGFRRMDDMAKRKKRAAGEGTVRKHASGSWEARLTVPGRKNPKSFYGKTQAEALEKREEAKKALLNGIDFDTGTQTLTDYFHSWLEDTVRVSLRRPTYEGYERMARNHITPTLGGIRLKDLKALHIQTLYASKFDAGYSLRTRRYIHTTLNKALKQAVRWNQIAVNPAADVEVPKADVEVLDLEDLPDPDMQTLAGDQVRLFLETAKGERLEALYVLALATGMRQGELLGLPWKHVDLKKGTLRVRQSLTLSKGGYTFSRPKTEASRRNLELRPEAIEALKAHRKRQLEETMRYNGLRGDLGLVFCSTTGTPIRRQNLQRRSFKPLLKKAGLPDIRFHDLRHTFATLTLAKGANVKTVSKMLGHSTIRVTLDVYAHVMPGMQSDALKTLDGLFS
jgi:integrase